MSPLNLRELLNLRVGFSYSLYLLRRDVQPSDFVVLSTHSVKYAFLDFSLILGKNGNII